jgi:hypothetical protein
LWVDEEVVESSFRWEPVFSASQFHPVLEAMALRFLKATTRGEIRGYYWYFCEGFKEETFLSATTYFRLMTINEEDSRLQTIF